MSKISQIRSNISNLRLPEPTASESNLMWFKPSRDSANYFRLTTTSDSDTDAYYDVWVEADLSIDKAGVYQFTMEAVLFDGTHSHQMDTTEIANLSFGDTEQSTMQTIINNWEPAYKKQAKEAVLEYTDWAEAELLDDLEQQAAE